MITAPFNFVPLSEKVFFPPWAESVSHDIPFEDGESGVIDITITAKSPIFIRDHEKPEEFCQYNGEYYISSSSVKGMVRNVLEIMSFGKISIDDEIHKKTMSIRDMTNRKELVGTAIGCGFLKQNSSGEWIIVDYGEPRTIEYDNKKDKTIDSGNESIDCNFETAQEKYDANGLYKRISASSSMKDLYKNGEKIGKKRVGKIANGQENAYLILTGGIDNKKNEFVFIDSDKNQELSLNQNVVDKFKKVYFDSNSIDGNFWRDNWNRDIGVPIFYIKDKNQNITDIGLSQLFKLAYNYTIDDATKQIIEIVTRDEKKYAKLDLAETIFGTIQESQEDKKKKRDTYALKGRVQFSHFKADSTPDQCGEVYTVLGSPRPSFYPEYIEQNCKDGKVTNDKYSTLMDKSAKIAGWKRYPLRFGKPKFIKAEDKTDSATRFVPLGNYNQNSFNEFTFSGKVRFHNLTKIELGAVLSALTFHGNQDRFYHNIGMAKSLGFGKIKIDIDTEEYKDSLVAYELVMNNLTEDKLQKKWIETEQIKELFTMAYKDLNIDDKLKYLKLNPDEKINEFVDMKKQKKCLPKCSEMFDIGEDYPNSMLTQEVLEEAQKREEEEKEKQLFNSKLKEALLTDNSQVIQNFINKYPNYEKIEEIKSKKEQLEQSKKEERHNEVNAKAQLAYDTLQKKKGSQKQYKKELEKFVKKWGAEKNNKDSKFVLELVEKAKGNQ